MATSTLFTLPIPTTPTTTGTGSIVCTTPSPGIYLLTFTSPPDNRLVTAVCQTFLLALDILEFSHPPGVVITTSGIPKFYSNGLDLQHATSTPGYWPNTLFALWRRLLTYPMPTIALLNGHAFAGGLMLAMYHDYRIFNPTRGFLCLNELDLGVPLKPPMASIFRQKLPAATFQKLVLEAKRFTAKEALDAGLVDALGGMDELLGFVRERKLTEKTRGGVYGVLRAEMWRETLGYLDGFEEGERRDREFGREEARRETEGRRRVDEWEKSGKGKAKL